MCFVIKLIIELVSSGELISVIVQNFTKIGQTVLEISALWCGRSVLAAEHFQSSLSSVS